MAKNIKSVNTSALHVQYVIWKTTQLKVHVQ